MRHAEAEAHARRHLVRLLHAVHVILHVLVRVDDLLEHALRQALLAHISHPANRLPDVVIVPVLRHTRPKVPVLRQFASLRVSPPEVAGRQLSPATPPPATAVRVLPTNEKITCRALICSYYARPPCFTCHAAASSSLRTLQCGEVYLERLLVPRAPSVARVTAAGVL